jgi:hypothetical protein
MRRSIRHVDIGRRKTRSCNRVVSRSLFGRIRVRTGGRLRAGGLWHKLVI